jgi:hypothetical protein
MEFFLGEAKEEGITDDEIGSVLSIVTALSGGGVRAQLSEVLARRNTGDD